MSKNQGAPRALPDKPNLENLKKQARGLLKQVRAESAPAIARVRKIHGHAIVPKSFALNGAQLVIAREYGFASWPKLRAAIERPAAVADASNVERLYTLLMRMARVTEWLSRSELSRLRAQGDLARLEHVANSLLTVPGQIDVVRVPDEKARFERLCAALERLLREPKLEPVGGESGGSSAEPEASAYLTVLAADGHPHLIGRRFPLIEPLTALGRGQENQIHLHSDSVSRAHARIERDGASFTLIDQKSTNGSFVNDSPEPVLLHTLSDGDRLALGDTILQFSSGADLEAKCRAAVDYVVDHDALTGLRNRLSWLAESDREVLHARGREHALSVLVLHVDQIESLKGRFGNLYGNSALLRASQALRQLLEGSVIVGRHGPEQFGITLPGVSLSRALELGERLRAELSSRPLRLADHQVELTVSIGVSTLYRTTGTFAELVEDALVALGRARAGGGNTIRGPDVAVAL